jgi:DNA-binding CsgD family transcriptional regulator
LKDRIPYSILNNPPNEGRANVYVVGDSVSFFSLNGGIGRYRFTDEILQETSNLQISSVAYYDRKNDRTFYLDPKIKGVIAYKHNDIVFQFSDPEFSKKIYRVECFLDGYDNRWVTTDEKLSIAYNNLPADEYILKARVLDNTGNELSTVRFSFRIKNPWFITWWAILSYIIILVLMSAWIIKNHIQKIIHKKNQLFIEQENRRLAQLERQEKEITSLRNEKLESELTFKGKELASATMMIINHSEFLRNLRSTIQQQILAGKINRVQGNELVNMIGNNLSEEDEWKLFQDNFDLIHQNFFRKLKERYPTLTPTDLKLCALLRLNYSSKEAASMLNISTRGVEAARYRLRKKMNLEESVNLVEFMLNFQ